MPGTAINAAASRLKRGSLSPGILVKMGCLGGIYRLANRLGGGIKRPSHVTRTARERRAGRGGDERTHAGDEQSNGTVRKPTREQGAT